MIYCQPKLLDHENAPTISTVKCYEGHSDFMKGRYLEIESLCTAGFMLLTKE